MTARVTTDVDVAASILRGGGLVAFATETVYGLGADATSATAVAGIFEAKQRPWFDPLIVHIADRKDLEQICEAPSAIATRLMDTFWPGPLTLVLPRLPVIPELVTSGLGTVGVRLPAHEQARELIRRAGVPVAAPSANLFGRVSPTCAAHVVEQLGERIDCVLDGGPCRVGIESTVLSLSDDSALPQLLRPGGISVEELEAVIGPIARPATPPADALPGIPQTAPGMLAQHYAPSKPMELQESLGQFNLSDDTGILTFRGFDGMEAFRCVEVLSAAGDLREAAANLFAALHRLDQSDTTRIVAEPVPEIGLGRAINDRLRRASARGV